MMRVSAKRPARSGLVTSASAPQALSRELRMAAERSLGMPLRSVRVHENARLPAGADAAASGERLFFRGGSYDPHSPEGRELIGHELAHVAQQRRGHVAGRPGEVNADAALEGEAERVGERAAHGVPASIARGAGPHEAGALQLGRQRRGRAKGRQKKRADPPRPDQHADDPMHFRELPPGPVRAYRVEVATQQYDDKGRAKWPHVHVGAGGGGHVYVPKPTSEYSVERKPNKNKFMRPQQPVPRPRPGDSHYAESFLRRQRDTGRNSAFVNFGAPERALELLRQKTENEPDKQFVVKSFQVPHETWHALRGQAVHERDANRYGTRPLGVDRKAPNQLGLKERHVDLLNATMLPGSARVETEDTLQRRLDRPAQRRAARQRRKERRRG